MRKSLYRRHNQVFLGLLRRYREQGKFRQRDLAQHLGSVQGTVSKAETGNRRLDVIELREWLLAMGVDFLEFMGELHRQLEALTPLDPWLWTVATKVQATDKPEDQALEPARLALRRQLLDVHIDALAEVLAPMTRIGLIQEITDTLAELDHLQIRGRPLSRWFESLALGQAESGTSALVPSEAEVLNCAQDVARLLLSNWFDVVANATSAQATQISDALRRDPPVLPLEVTTGCLAFPIPEEQARYALTRFLQARWTPELLSRWRAAWRDEH